MLKAEYRCLCVSCTELETKGSKLLWSSTGSAPDRGLAVVAMAEESGLRRSVSHRVQCRLSLNVEVVVVRHTEVGSRVLEGLKMCRAVIR